MSSDAHGNSSHNSPMGGGYTPAPVKKTRAVTGTQVPQLQDQPAYQESIHPGVNQVQSTQSSEPVKPSIQLNLNTMDQAAQDVLEKEAEAHNKLATFSPLSSTPVEYQRPEPDYHVAPQFANSHGQPQDSWQNSIPDSLTPSPHYQAVSAEVPDLYKSRRRSLMLLLILFLVSAWFIAMAVQIGITRLVKDPYGETMKALTGVEHNADELDKLRAPVVQNTIVIEEGRAVARVLSVEVLDKQLVAVKGVLLNESTSVVESALLKLTLKSESNAKNGWAQQYEFACCEQYNHTQMSPEEIQEKVQRSRSQLMQADQDLGLEEGASKSFTFIAKISDKKVRLKASELPQADLEVTFFE